MATIGLSQVTPLSRRMKQMNIKMAVYYNGISPLYASFWEVFLVPYIVSFSQRGNGILFILSGILSLLLWILVLAAFSIFFNYVPSCFSSLTASFILYFFWLIICFILYFWLTDVPLYLFLNIFQSCWIIHLHNKDQRWHFFCYFSM